MTGTSTLTLNLVLVVLHLIYQKFLIPYPIQPFYPTSPEWAFMVDYLTGSKTIFPTGNRRLFWMDMSPSQLTLPQESLKGLFWAPYFSPSPWTQLPVYLYRKTLRLSFMLMTIYKPITSHNDAIGLQSDINMVTNWLSDCGLKLNPAKTKFMLISRKCFPPNLSVCIEGTPIIQVESLKYLGVTITSDLSWSTHINSTCTKARKQLGFLYQNFYQANRQSIAYLYKATVLPLLDYCCCVWDPHQSTYTAKLEKVQKFAAKLSGQKTTIIFSHFSWQLDDSNKSYCYVEEF